MDFKPGTLKHLQEYIDFMSESRGFNDESVEERLIVLTEEIGEVMKAYRKQAGMYVNQADKKEENIGHEIADVLNLLFAVATGLGIDVEKSFLEKEAKNLKRSYKRS